MTDKKAVLHLLMNFKNHIRFSVVLTLLSMLAAGSVFVFILDPEYEASSQLLIAESAPAIPHQAVESNQIDFQVVEAYAAFMESPEVLQQVRKELKLGNSIADLREQIQVSYTSNSPLLTVTVSSDNSNQALKTTNALAFIFKNEVESSLKEDNVNIISQASLKEGNGDPSQKNLMLALIVAAVSGFFLSILIATSLTAAKNAANATNRDIRKKENQLQTVFK